MVVEENNLATRFYCFQCGHEVKADEISFAPMSITLCHAADNGATHHRRLDLCSDGGV